MYVCRAATVQPLKTKAMKKDKVSNETFAALLNLTASANRATASVAARIIKRELPLKGHGSFMDAVTSGNIEKARMLADTANAFCIGEREIAFAMELLR